jgi:hypothetical protein
VTPLVAVGARVDVSVFLGWKVWLVALAELRGALAQTSIRVGNEPVWVTPPVSGVVGAALELRTDSGERDK